METYLGAALRGPLAAILPHHEGLTEFRRDLHANPEIGFEEHRTAALVAERLKSFGVEVHTGIGKTGVVGVIRGKGERTARSIGLQLGAIIAFAIVTETVFQWPGMGLLFIQAVNFADVPVMAAYLCFIALVFVTINLVVDLLYYAVDPRLRVERAGGGGH